MRRSGLSAEPAVWIVGAGWAGLAAAIRLQSAGVSIGLLEQSSQVGGRARDIQFRGRRLDIGQHLLLGAYRQFLELLRLAELDPDSIVARAPLRLQMRDATGCVLDLHLRRGAGRAGRLLSLLRAGGGGIAAALGASRLLRPPRQDCSVDAWLRQRGQSERLCERLWRPLCLAALNTPAQTASAQVFSRVLAETFSSAQGGSDLLLPRGCLGETVAAPLLRRLFEQAGSRIRLATPVRQLRRKGAGFELQTRDGETIPARRLILAGAWHATARLLQSITGLEELSRRLAGWQSNPITTLYLGYAGPAPAGPVLTGLLDGPVQWLIDRGHCGQPGVLAAVVSADEAPPDGDWEARATAMLAQIARHRPQAPAWYKLTRERHATFHCDPTTQAQRPANAVAGQALWLAGDYTDTGLPATLEGAVVSGFAAADALLADAA